MIKLEGLKISRQLEKKCEKLNFDKKKRANATKALVMPAYGARGLTRWMGIEAESKLEFDSRR